MDFKIQIPKTRTAQNETEPLKLFVKLADKNEYTSLEQTLYSTSEKIEKITFREIKIGAEVKISANIYDSGILLYTGETEYKKVEPANNVFSLTLKKVNTEEPEPDPPAEPENPAEPDTPTEPEIINAQVPEISIPIQSIVELATPNSDDIITRRLSIGATLLDGGNISFQWQTKKDENWTYITDTDEEQTKSDNINISTLQITIEKGSTQYYRCIVTNTNENVNGEKTASITSEEATVAYFEGKLTSIKATYNSTGYEIFGNEFYDAEKKEYDYSNIGIEETYSFSNGDTKTYNTQYSSDNYSIQKSNEVENAIGYVTYTVTYNDGTTSGASISNTMYVPVKYKLSADSLSISGTPNETATWGTESNPEKVAQHTGSSTLAAKYSSNISLYSKENSSEVADFNILDNCSISWSTGTKNADNSVTVDNSIAGNFTYTATLTSNSEWIVGEEISAKYYITVCPWEIAIKDNEGKTDLTESKDKLDGNTLYTLFATNEAESPSDEITWISTNSDFSINAGTLSTPEATTETQTATITAKVGEKSVKSIEVSVQGSSVDDGTIKSVSDLYDYFDSDNEYYALTNGTYIFESDITLDYPIYILSDYSVTLLSNKNVTITSSFNNDNLIYVDRTGAEVCGKLTLGGGEGTLTLKHVNQTYPTITSYGDLTLANNCAITESQYCAIQIKNGDFKMTGGEIFNNTYTGTNVQSSAITLDFTAKSYAYFEGGKIYNNKTTTSGGGIMISDNSTLSTIMIEGVEIYNNSASQNGGGIYSDTAIFIYSPSKIYTNYVNDSDCGASIYVTDAVTDYDESIYYFYIDSEAISTNPYNENIDL